VVEQAKNLVRRPEFAAAKTDEQKLDVIYQLIYSRPPRPEEARLATAFLAQTGPVKAVAAAPAQTQPVLARGKPKKTVANKKRPEPQVEAFRPRAPLNAWEELAHALFIANEASFVN
jgi:hypothetical protein